MRANALLEPRDADAAGSALPQGPVLLGGFAFEPDGARSAAWAGFPAGLMVVPRFLFAGTAEGGRLVISVLVGAESDPDAEAATLLDERAALLAPVKPGTPAAGAPAIRVRDVLPGPTWESSVADAAAAIRAGALDKVVLAREVEIGAEGPFDLAATLRRLAAGYPDCYLFAVARGPRCFLGASPERLVRLADGAVRATCLAGSTRRSADPDEDARLGAALLASTKNQREHALVVRTLAGALGPLCADLQVAAAPTLLRLRNVQHLYTPIRGRLHNGTTLLELVARLHPTPAVGGYPQAAALAYIGAHEQLDRGWYAAPVGWVDSAGAGEFAVAIRSALLDGAEARAFGGCGIMGDSEPESEYAESQVKLRAILSALGEARG